MAPGSVPPGNGATAGALPDAEAEAKRKCAEDARTACLAKREAALAHAQQVEQDAASSS
jgi:hypothetical protein